MVEHEREHDIHGGEDDGGELVVIYTAASGTEANLLRNLLGEAGIRSVLSNTVLEGGAGVDILGWPTMPRVAVARHDAQAARDIALEFDRTVSKHGVSPTEPAPREERGPASRGLVPGMGPDWPRCPRCHARRTTRCPICHTEGFYFEQADPNTVETLGVADDATPLETCGCGSGSCHKEEPPDRAVHEGEPAAETASAAAAPPYRLTLLCPTCDEPFVPQYARRCAECGHEFDEGFEVVEPPEAEHFDYRLVVLIAIVLAVLGLLFVHFAMVTPGP